MYAMLATNKLMTLEVNKQTGDGISDVYYSKLTSKSKVSIVFAAFQYLYRVRDKMRGKFELLV